MKKVAIVFLIAIILISCVGLTACNYTRDENHLRGIYGISSSTFTDSDGVEYNYGDDYEYLLLVINKDLSAFVRSKRAGEDENSYPVTLSYEMNDDGEIDNVTISGIKMPVRSENDKYGFVEIEEDEGTSFTFRSFGSLRLVSSSNSVKVINGDTVWIKSKTVFKRLYKMTGDCNQKRAIRKQTKSIEDRQSATDED